MTGATPREGISPISRDGRIRCAAYAGVLAAYLAAVRDDPLTPFQLSFFGAAAAWSLAGEHRWSRPYFAPPLKIGLIGLGAFIFVLFVSSSLGGPAESFANSIARFLFWNAIVFVLSRNKTEYDLWTLAIIELSLFMISAAFAQPPEFLPLLFVSAACLVYVFQRAALLRCGRAGLEERRGLGLAFTSLLLALEVGAVAFLGFPRLAFRQVKPPGAALPADGPSTASQDDPLGGRSGIPRNPAFMTLTNFDRLKLDPQKVLRIRVTDADGAPVPADRTPYLRGAVLDTYEGGRWRARFSRDPRKAGGDGWTALERAAPRGRPIVSQHIRASAISGDLSFCVPDPVRVKWDGARYDREAGILFFERPPRGMVEYDVESALMPLDIPDSLGRPAPPSPERWLQLPPGLEKLRAVAVEQSDRAKGRHAKVMSLVQFLMRNGFAYKLGPFVPAEGRDPVEHFLEQKQGYCVHYASALALMCRAAGVPARVATGFQLHDPDETGAIDVRNSDAHAWVEAWFGPEHGWRAYDATPDEGRLAAAPPEGDPVATLEQKKKAEEAAKKLEASRRWDQSILDFDPKLQSEALGKVAGAVVRAVGGAARFVFSPPVMLTLAVLAASMAALYALLPGKHRRRLRQIASGFREGSAVDFYRDFLWALSKRGVRRHPALTAREFARQARAAVGDEGVDFVTAKFEEARWRGTPPTADERRRIDEVIARLLLKPGHETAEARRR